VPARRTPVNVVLFLRSQAPGSVRWQRRRPRRGACPSPGARARPAARLCVPSQRRGRRGQVRPRSQLQRAGREERVRAHSLRTLLASTAHMHVCLSLIAQQLCLPSNMCPGGQQLVGESLCCFCRVTLCSFLQYTALCVSLLHVLGPCAWQGETSAKIASRPHCAVATQGVLGGGSRAPCVRRQGEQRREQAAQRRGALLEADRAARHGPPGAPPRPRGCAAGEGQGGAGARRQDRR